jgi:hypothetical protein
MCFSRALLMAAASLDLSIFASATTCASEIAEPQSVQGLQFQKDGNAVVLSWPSDPQEMFAVLWRSNSAVETRWQVLDGQMRATPATNCTTFRHNNAATTPLPELYRVFVVPDFRFDMQGVILSGGPKNPGQDFLPFYYGNTETDFFKLSTELLVDGQPVGAGSTLDEGVRLVNFGTTDKPRWAYSAGFWFHHDEVAEGTHILQIQSTFHLNSFVGQWSWSATSSNNPVQVVARPHLSEVRGGELLLGRAQRENGYSWWVKRLGQRFVRKQPSAQEAAVDKLRSAGFVPQANFQDGLRATIDHFRFAATGQPPTGG